MATVSICNNFPTIDALCAHLDELNLLDEERLRPGWDMYFMVSPRRVDKTCTEPRRSHLSHHIVQTV